MLYAIIYMEEASYHFSKRRIAMRITFYGAAHEVTGSCTVVSALGKNIMIDCGLEQGPDIY